jgi:hypothetical protein
MSSKLDRIEKEMQRGREKIAEQQNKLKELDGQRTEAENLLIIGAVRAMCVTREELAAFIRGDALTEQPAPRRGRREATDSQEENPTAEYIDTQEDADHENE